MAIIEIGITSQSQLKTVEKNRKGSTYTLIYEMHKMKTKIIPWPMTWDGIYKHKQYFLGINSLIEA